MNWNLFKQIISDRNKKFMNKFWFVLFTKLKIRLFYSTVYHLQIDKLSEKTNQFAEIALKYHFFTLFNFTEWSNVLSIIQKGFNNSISFVEKTSNEIVYDFTFVNLSNIISSLKNKISAKWICQKISNAIAFFHFIVKHHYDRKHKFIKLTRKIEFYFDCIKNTIFCQLKISDESYFSNTSNHSKSYRK